MSNITVKRGDTLSKIARQFNTTPEKIAQANGITDINKIKAGQRLTITDGFGQSRPKAKVGAGKSPGYSGKSSFSDGAKAGATVGAKAASGPKATTTKATPASDASLGALSRKYESTGPGTVSTGKGDAGGVSYGSYQFATKAGTPQKFVDSLKTSHPDYHQALSGSKPGSAAFTKAWKDLAKKDPTGFGQAQHDFIKATYFDPAASKIAKGSNLDVSTRSGALRDVVWSTAVQHGVGGSASIIKAALKGRDPSTVTDAQLIKDIYAERGRTDANGTLVHFSSNSKSVQAGVANRFKNEQRDALAMLSKEK